MSKKIYLIDLTHEGKLGIGSDTMPLQLGLIGAYCQKELGDEVEVEIFKYVSEFTEAVMKEPPFIIGASNYLWNLDLSYKFVQAARRLHPEIITIFGGPNYPDEKDEQIEWLSQYPDMDFYIFRDGEIPFANLVRRLIDNPDIDAVKQECLSSVHAIHDGQAYFGETEPRLKDLSQIPSAYASGLMEKFFDHPLVPPIQTNRGCPFTCTFCTEGSSYYTKVNMSSLERIEQDIDYIAARIKHTKILRITDSNFGMYAQDIQIAEMIAEKQRTIGYPEYITCSAGKNKKERILKCNEILGGAMRLTASVQSLSSTVLENVKRKNISVDNLFALSDQVSDTDTHSYSELILALPGDSLEANEQSLDGLMAAGISNITQHQLALIYGTELNSRATREKYGLKEMFRPIQRCAGSYTFGDEKIPAVEIEGICVANNTLSFDDYIECRKMYLTVGLFYNDRVFGEIHALLRILGISTFGWIKLIHQNIGKLDANIRTLYQGFVDETLGELWGSREKLISDVEQNIELYDRGDAGGNIIYKYRAKSFAEHFEKLHNTAFQYLREYLAAEGVACEDAVNDIEKLSRYRKFDLFNISPVWEDTFNYDVLKLISDASFARQGGALEELRGPIQLRVAHSSNQQQAIPRDVENYGNTIAGLTMLLSRLPIKKFYRTVSRFDG